MECHTVRRIVVYRGGCGVVPGFEEGLFRTDSLELRGKTNTFSLALAKGQPIVELPVAEVWLIQDSGKPRRCDE